MLNELPPYVLVARIGSILGMAFALSIGLLFLIGGSVLLSVVAFAAFAPAFGLMVLVERLAEGRSGGRTPPEA